MKNIKALTLAFLLSVFGSSYALAEYGVTVGVTGSMAMIDASGTEIEGNAKERSDADVSNNAGVGSIFIEYNESTLSIIKQISLSPNSNQEVGGRHPQNKNVRMYHTIPLTVSSQSQCFLDSIQSENTLTGMTLRAIHTLSIINTIFILSLFQILFVSIRQLTIPNHKQFYDIYAYLPQYSIFHTRGLVFYLNHYYLNRLSSML